MRNDYAPLARIAKACNQRQPLSAKASKTLDVLRPWEWLAVYGTLAPGQHHHRHVASISGVWQRARAYGAYSPLGWGHTQEYPGYRWVENGNRPTVSLALLYAPTLFLHWRALDDFEGPCYQRVLVPVLPRKGSWRLANIYTVKSGPPQ